MSSLHPSFSINLIEEIGKRIQQYTFSPGKSRFFLLNTEIAKAFSCIFVKVNPKTKLYEPSYDLNSNVCDVRLVSDTMNNLFYRYIWCVDQKGISDKNVYYVSAEALKFFQEVVKSIEYNSSTAFFNKSSRNPQSAKYFQVMYVTDDEKKSYETRKYGEKSDELGNRRAEVYESRENLFREIKTKEISDIFFSDEICSKILDTGKGDFINDEFNILKSSFPKCIYVVTEKQYNEYFSKADKLEIEDEKNSSRTNLIKSLSGFSSFNTVEISDEALKKIKIDDDVVVNDKFNIIMKDAKRYCIIMTTNQEYNDNVDKYDKLNIEDERIDEEFDEYNLNLKNFRRSLKGKTPISRPIVPIWSGSAGDKGAAKFILTCENVNKDLKPIFGKIDVSVNALLNFYKNPSNYIKEKKDLNVARSVFNPALWSKVGDDKVISLVTRVAEKLNDLKF